MILTFVGNLENKSINYLESLLKTPNLNGISRNEINFALTKRLANINNCRDCEAL